MFEDFLPCFQALIQVSESKTLEFWALPLETTLKRLALHMQTIEIFHHC